jgi:hypothetical protein
MLCVLPVHDDLVNSDLSVLWLSEQLLRHPEQWPKYHPAMQRKHNPMSQPRVSNRTRIRSCHEELGRLDRDLHLQSSQSNEANCLELTPAVQWEFLPPPIMSQRLKARDMLNVYVCI